MLAQFGLGEPGTIPRAYATRIVPAAPTDHSGLALVVMFAVTPAGIVTRVHKPGALNTKKATVTTHRKVPSDAVLAPEVDVRATSILYSKNQWIALGHGSQDLRLMAGPAARD